MNILGGIYYSANDLEKSSQFYRKALKLKPDYLTAINHLAANIFEQRKDLNEGMDLINKALEINPENPLFLSTKGEGLYQQGKYKEALENFEKAWAIYKYYNHDLYLDIQEAKQAIAKQENVK